MGDKYANGFISGLAGGVAAAATNLLLILFLKFGNVMFGDFAGVLVFGYLPKSFWEIAIAYLVYFGFAGTLGVIFAYLIPVLSFKYFLFKGIHFGIGVWFFSYVITLLFKVPELMDISLKSAVTNFLASFVYGLVMAMVLRWLCTRATKREENMG